MIGKQSYLVWSNEHNSWWAPNHQGYVNNVDAAGRYSLKEAIEICNGANYSWDNDLTKPNELPISEEAALRLERKIRRYTGQI